MPNITKQEASRWNEILSLAVSDATEYGEKAFLAVTDNREQTLWYYDLEQLQKQSL